MKFLHHQYSLIFIQKFNYLFILKKKWERRTNNFLKIFFLSIHCRFSVSELCQLRYQFIFRHFFLFSSASKLLMSSPCHFELNKWFSSSLDLINIFFVSPSLPWLMCKLIHCYLMFGMILIEMECEKLPKIPSCDSWTISCLIEEKKCSHAKWEIVIFTRECGGWWIMSKDVWSWRLNKLCRITRWTKKKSKRT